MLMFMQILKVSMENHNDKDTKLQTNRLRIVVIKIENGLFSFSVNVINSVEVK